jgi:AcrR family transcriptional regulator
MRTKDLDKQQRIKDAMVRLILREGINGASVAKIAREAEVSPATIYVYYSSKEEMLAEVFREYSRQSYRFLMRRIQPGMGGAELIDAIVRGYFDYSVEYEEVFSFVEQCSRCPTLSSQACDEESGCDLFDLIHAYQAKGLVRQFSDRNLAAVLFSPVRHLAMNRMRVPGSPDAELQELIRMLQELLLR